MPTNVYDQFDKPEVEAGEPPNVYDQFDAVTTPSFTPQPDLWMPGETPESPFAQRWSEPLPPKPYELPKPAPYDGPQFVMPDNVPSRFGGASTLTGRLPLSMPATGGVLSPVMEGLEEVTGNLKESSTSLVPTEAWDAARSWKDGVTNPKIWADALDVAVAGVKATKGFTYPINEADFQRELEGPNRTPSVVEKVASGAHRAVVDNTIGLAEFFTSPLGIGTLGTGALPKVAQRVVSGLFAINLARYLPDFAVELWNAFKEGDPQRIAEAAANLGINGIFTGGLAWNAARGPGRGPGFTSKDEPPSEGGGRRSIDPADFAAKFEASFKAGNFDQFVADVKASKSDVYGGFARNLSQNRSTSPDAASRWEWFLHLVRGTRPDGADVPVTSPISSPIEILESPESKAARKLGLVRVADALEGKKPKGGEKPNVQKEKEGLQVAPVAEPPVITPPEVTAAPVVPETKGGEIPNATQTETSVAGAGATSTGTTPIVEKGPPGSGGQPGGARTETTQTETPALTAERPDWRTETGWQPNPITREAAAKQLREEGVKPKDVDALLNGSRSIEEVIGDNLRDFNPPHITEATPTDVGGEGHASAWIRAFNEAYMRLSYVMDNLIPKTPAPAPVPQAPDLEQHLQVERVDVTDAKAAIRANTAKRAELNKRIADNSEKIKTITSRVETGSGFLRRIKKSAPKKDLAELKALRDESGSLMQEVDALARANMDNEVLVDRDQAIAKMTDKSKPLLHRLAARINLERSKQGEAPPQVLEAFENLLDAEIRKHYPEATRLEVAGMRDALERDARSYSDLDNEFDRNPQLNLKARRQNVLRSMSDLKGWVWQHADNPKGEEQKARWHELYGQEMPQIAGIEQLRAELDESEKVIQAASAARTTDAERAAAENAAAAQKMLDEAEAVVQSQPRAGGAKRVKAELVSRFEETIDALIKSRGVTATQEAGQWVAKEPDGNGWAAGMIVRDGKRFEVTARTSTGKASATFESKEDGLRFIKAFAASEPGKVVIAIPGDGIWQLNRHGPSLAKLMVRVMHLNTADNIASPGVGKASAKVKAAPKIKKMTPQETVDAMKKKFSVDDKRGYGEPFVDDTRAVAMDGRTIIEVAGNFPKPEPEEGAPAFPIENVDNFRKARQENDGPPITVPTDRLWRISGIAETVEVGGDLKPVVTLFVQKDGQIGGESMNQEGDSARYGEPKGATEIGTILAGSLANIVKFAKGRGIESLTIQKKKTPAGERSVFSLTAPGFSAVMGEMDKIGPAPEAPEAPAQAAAPEPTAPPVEQKLVGGLEEQRRLDSLPTPETPEETKARKQHADDTRTLMEALSGEVEEGDAIPDLQTETAEGLERQHQDRIKWIKNMVAGGYPDKRILESTAAKELGNRITKRLIREARAAAGSGDMARAPGGPVTDAWERAQQGDETAWADLEEQIDDVWPEDPAVELGRPDPNAAYNRTQFTAWFDQAFADHNFEKVLNMIKATDVAVYKPYLRELFQNQSRDPVAAAKAEWFRHVFAGTWPPGANPPKAKTPGPTPATPPPNPPPGPGATPPPPPGAPAQKIPINPIKGGPAKDPYKIMADWEAALGKQLRVLRMKRGRLGVYSPGNTLTAIRSAGDISTVIHESGHMLDDQFSILAPWKGKGKKSPYDAELAQFWIYGTREKLLWRKRAEGLAEWLHAYVSDPTRTTTEAPKLTAYVLSKLPTKMQLAIDQFSKEVRTWYGLNPLEQVGVSIQQREPTPYERTISGIRGKGFGFKVSPVDQMRSMFDDSLHFAVKAWQDLKCVRGGQTLPKDDFELMARLLSTHEDRLMDQFERGFTKFAPKQVTNAKGKQEVERLIDPRSGEVMNLEWELGAFDKSSPAALMQDMEDTSAFMVAQRTVEKAGQLGRTSGISGIGHGFDSDLAKAQAVLAEAGRYPVKLYKLEEGARRYRLLADTHIQWLVDSGRITPEQAFKIRDANEFYVDMHRLSEEFEVAHPTKRSTLAAKRDLKKMKGSNLQIKNVYTSLMNQLDMIQREAHRNNVMNLFADGLRSTRKMYGPNRMDLDQFGRQVKVGDKNAISIFNKGKEERWQFAPHINQAMKGLSELPPNAFVNMLLAPSAFTRYMITMGPSFMIRNPIRDTTERSVNSISGTKPWSIFQGYTQEELSRYQVFGGGQFGNYITSRYVWDKEVKRVIDDMTGQRGNIFLWPGRLKEAWERLGRSTEILGRVTEFRAAYAKWQKQLAKEYPGMAQDEIDYNAALAASGEARALMDYAKAGTIMKWINRASPFTNANLRGLAKVVFGAKNHAGLYALNWALYVLAPTLAVLAWNRSDEERWKEYLQLPAYRRDFFWNFKVGDTWVMLPKPHLLGVLAGGVERLIMKAMGEKHAGEGFGKSLSSNLPINNVAEALGPLQTFVELFANRDFFRDRPILPEWERGLKLELREGTKFASGAGRSIADALNTTGLTIDSRHVDHVLNSMGGLGSLLTSATRKDATLMATGARGTGLSTDAPGVEAQDVKWLLSWAEANGKLMTREIAWLKTLRKAVLQEPSRVKREERKATLRNYATVLRERIETREAAKP
jgi:hypothetical protein